MAMAAPIDREEPVTIATLSTRGKDIVDYRGMVRNRLYGGKGVADEDDDIRCPQTAYI